MSETPKKAARAFTSMVREITDVHVKKAKPETRITDTRAPGLMLETNKTFVRRWYMRHTVQGQQIKYRIGTYPEMTLTQARQVAFAYLAAAEAGKDPRDGLDTLPSKKIAGLGVADWTLEQLTQAYIDWASVGWNERSGRGHRILQVMAHYVYPVTGAQYRALDLTLTQVYDILTPIAQNTPGQFATIQKIVTAVINHMTMADNTLHGRALHLDRGQVSKYFKKYMANYTPTHYAAVPTDKAHDFYQHFANVANQNTAGTGHRRARRAVAAEAILFIMLTGARTAEVIGHKPKPGNPGRYTPPMIWREVDMDRALWIIPGNRTKNGYNHEIPLSRAAVKLLRQVRAKTGRGAPDDLVFPSHLDKHHGGMMSANGLLSQIKKGPKFPVITSQKNAAALIEERHPTTHGLRTTFTTFAAKAGYPLELISFAIAHKPAHFQADTNFETYMRSKMVEERRPLMEAWANYCVNGILPKGWRDDIDIPQAANVAQLA